MSVNYQHKYLKYKTKYRRLLQIEGGGPSEKLHLACKSGLVGEVRSLLQKNADVNITDNDGKTPLHVACMNNKIDVVKALIENDADVNITDNDGKTGLDIARTKNHLEITKFLEPTPGHGSESKYFTDWDKTSIFDIKNCSETLCVTNSSASFFPTQYNIINAYSTWIQNCLYDVLVSLVKSYKQISSTISMKGLYDKMCETIQLCKKCCETIVNNNYNPGANKLGGDNYKKLCANIFDKVDTKYFKIDLNKKNKTILTNSLQGIENIDALSILCTVK